MWWLGLFFDRLALQIARCGALASGDEVPLAICDRSIILDADANAQVLGIAPGMKRAAALALAPALMLRERDAAREQATLEQLAAWALQFTPSVSLQADLPFDEHGDTSAACGLLLEVAASLRYFGGPEALSARLRTGLRALGYTARIGAAPTAAAAWLFARHRDGLSGTATGLRASLEALPSRLLARTRAQRETLDAIGAHRIGELLALPRTGLARRCGPALLDELDRALGHRPEPRRWFEAPARFDAQIELLARVDRAEALLFAARRLVDPLVAWLAARHGALRAFVLHAIHDRRDARADTLLTIRLADPSRDPERLLALLRETLAVTRLPAPAHALRLRCEQVLALPAASGSLLPAPGTAHESLARLIERLQARLGAHGIQRLSLAADHRPEAAYRIEAAGARPGARPAADLPVAGLPRPLWLLHEPVAIGEREHRPWWRTPLTLLAGPERIEGGWWDGTLVQRDYFVAEDATHALYWIYRERPAPGGERGGWFVHGRFG